MWSKNKASQTKAESEHVAKLAQMSCVVCDEPGPSEVHEFEQGAWWAAVPLCTACHRNSDGWHGTRARWTLRKMDMVKAINETIRRLFA